MKKPLFCIALIATIIGLCGIARADACEEYAGRTTIFQEGPNFQIEDYAPLIDWQRVGNNFSFDVGVTVYSASRGQVYVFVTDDFQCTYYLELNFISIFRDGFEQ